MPDATSDHEPPRARVERLRRAVDGDADGLIALVGAAYDEHPGCVLDLPGIDRDLTEPGTTAGRRGSPWWVVEDDGPARGVIATIGCGLVDDDGAAELKRLYVAADQRGRGLATRLIDLVERHAAGLGARCVELWSDTRFTDAHRRYAALGYERTGEDRRLHDPSDTTEWRFVKRITPTPPDREVTWLGPFGTDRATLTALPDGWRLTADTDGTSGSHAAVVRADVEVDGTWRSRRAEVTVAATDGDARSGGASGGASRRLTTDAAGTWWLDGEDAPWLAGAVDVDVEATPLTNTLPIRRLLAAGSATGTETEVTAAWLRVPGPAVEVLTQTYTPLGDGRWRYRSAGGFSAVLSTDADGLVHDYGDLWTRA